MSSLLIRPDYEDLHAIEFCREFLSGSRPRYVFGRNEFCRSIIDLVGIDGVIDEFTNEREFHSVPIVPIESIPANALVVVVVVVGKPLIAEKSVRQYQFDSLDYYAFLKYSGLQLKQIQFLDGAKEDIERNYDEYSWIYDRLKDGTSRNQLYNLLNFRVSSNLSYMRGFVFEPHRQYFEPFIEFSDGEVFVDAGGFDGSTTEEFIRRVPSYGSAHVFEPQPDLLEVSCARLKQHRDVTHYSFGLSNRQGDVRFRLDGSASGISENGEGTVHVEALDDVLKDVPTFIKMDIEGAELAAIDGCREAIEKHHPKMAICVYHRKDDVYKIPRKVLGIRPDYDIYLRHYTEGVFETVMYFVPTQVLGKLSV